MPYCVLHGLEGYPQSLGRDLDVIAPQAAHATLIEAAGRALEGLGWRCAELPSPWDSRPLFAFRTGVGLEIDLLDRLRWGPVLLAEPGLASGRMGPFKTDPGPAFAKRVLWRYLHGGMPGVPFLAADETAAAEALCARVFGAGPAAELLAALRACDPGALARLRGGLRRAAYLRAAFRAPWQVPSSMIRRLRRFVRARVVRMWPVVIVTGPDGAGKSTVLAVAAQSFPPPLQDALVRHWRPGLLPVLARLAGRSPAVPDSTGLLPPRRSAGTFSPLRLAYYLADYWLGRLAMDNPGANHIRAVLYDRGALDVSVAPERFGAAPGRLSALFARLAPQADLCVLLWADPRLSRARKPENTPEQAEHDARRWRCALEQGAFDAVVDAEGDPAAAAEAVVALTLDAALRRGSRSAPGTDPLAFFSNAGSPYHRLDAGHGRVFLAAAGHPESAAALGAVYRPESVRGRLALSAASMLLRAGIPPAPLRRVSIDDRALRAAFAEVLGREDFAVGLALHGGRRAGKAVAAAVGAGGRTLAYAKQACIPGAVPALERERAALQAPRAQARVLRVPAMLAWRPGPPHILVQEAGPGDSVASLDDVAAAAREVSGPPSADAGRLEAWLSALAASAELVESAHTRRALARHLPAAFSGARNACLPMSSSHGDFAPWNLAAAGGRVWAYDWESWSENRPDGWDLAHWVFSRSRLARRPLDGLLDGFVRSARWRGWLMDYLADTDGSKALALTRLYLLSNAVSRGLPGGEDPEGCGLASLTVVEALDRRR
ncbi:MAG: hypothetical protein HY928_14040 [Elusimicrobia bacterium]|nr:hypothetical protein [Elusimicrobiota bacterium]